MFLSNELLLRMLNYLGESIFVFKLLVRFCIERENIEYKDRAIYKEKKKNKKKIIEK